MYDKENIPIKGAKVLILGITFKENCPDVRNTIVVELISSLKEYGVNILVSDPWANNKEVMIEYGIKSITSVPKEKFDCIVLAVSHNEFKMIDFKLLRKEVSVVYDVKNILDKSLKDKTL